jgi:hypothetical protein
LVDERIIIKYVLKEYILRVKGKVKAIPGVSLRVPELLGSKISTKSAYECDKDVSSTHRPPLPFPRKILLVFIPRQ